MVMVIPTISYARGLVFIWDRSEAVRKRARGRYGGRASFSEPHQQGHVPEEGHAGEGGVLRLNRGLPNSGPRRSANRGQRDSTARDTEVWKAMLLVPEGSAWLARAGTEPAWRGVREE